MRFVVVLLACLLIIGALAAGVVTYLHRLEEFEDRFDAAPSCPVNPGENRDMIPKAKKETK